MIFKKFCLKVTVLALSLLTLSASSDASQHCHRNSGVRPAQANYQSETVLAPTLDQPISFSTENFRTNVEVSANNSVFEVKVPGLYSIDSFLLLNVPNIGDTVAGYITINDKKLLTFFSSVTRTLSSPIVNFHFFDRLVYLDKGDRVSVILSQFTPGTTVLASGFVMIALNNSH